MILVENVFQRLTTSLPGQSQVAPGVWAYKPDLAQECSFPSTSAFVCTLRPDLTFSNGHPLTSADVKFSIDRAIRLAVPGSSASALDSVQRIETPDARTVRFVLRRYDKQFGWALAGPAASIVDHTVYSSDAIQARNAPIVGSGPFRVTALENNRLKLARFDRYQGRTPAQLSALQVLTEPDSASVESAMNDHRADLVWRGLSPAALSRLANQVQVSTNRTTAAGFSQQVLPGARVQQLRWNPGSDHRNNRALRAAVADTLQEDRTLDSLVPPQIPGHRAAFPVGGRPHATITWANLIPLTLGFDPSVADGKRTADQLRNQLEATGGLSVQIRADDHDADLQLEDRKAWTPTAISWLQPLLEEPLRSSAATIRQADDQVRTGGPQAASSALTALQTRAAEDKVVLPLTQQNEYIYTASGIKIMPTSFGPGWHLGLWGITRQL
ncbi:peptide/nickel transport system substrate-binding protein [Microlunatus soli]|uniref:Peptide/nickel transport system substrate-binding protein n=2 Tax=Microlunatus soli TaxID=630515 RepID=A0A1H1SFJ0_9ACTN|nr:peptide/nickel transport system substrate-binding protein [Microlunatus soli]